MSRPKTLAGEAVTERLARKLPGWQFVAGEIERSFRFSGFPAAMAFVQRVAEAAENANHHPEILIQYNQVRLRLRTHDAGGVTELDFALAERVDQLVG